MAPSIIDSSPPNPLLRAKEVIHEGDSAMNRKARLRPRPLLAENFQFYRVDAASPDEVMEDPVTKTKPENALKIDFIRCPGYPSKPLVITHTSFNPLNGHATLPGCQNHRLSGHPEQCLLHNAVIRQAVETRRESLYSDYQGPIFVFKLPDECFPVKVTTKWDNKYDGRIVTALAAGEDAPHTSNLEAIALASLGAESEDALARLKAESDTRHEKDFARLSRLGVYKMEAMTQAHHNLCSQLVAFGIIPDDTKEHGNIVANKSKKRKTALSDDDDSDIELLEHIRAAKLAAQNHTGGTASRSTKEPWPAQERGSYSVNFRYGKKYTTKEWERKRAIAAGRRGQ